MVALLNKCYFFVFIFILCNCKINSVGRKKTKSNSERNINKFVKSNGSDVIADFYENNDTKSSLEKVNNIPIWNNKNTNEHFIGGIVELAKDDLNSTKSSFGTMYKNIFTNYESVEKVIVGIHNYILNQNVNEEYPRSVLDKVNGCFEHVETSINSVLKECENNLRNKKEKTVESISTKDFLQERIRECNFLNEVNIRMWEILVNIINEFYKLNSFFCKINKENKEISGVNKECVSLYNIVWFNMVRFNQGLNFFYKKLKLGSKNIGYDLLAYFKGCHDIETIIKGEEGKVKGIENKRDHFSVELVSFENSFVLYSENEGMFAKDTNKSIEKCEKEYVSNNYKFKCNVNKLKDYREVVFNLIKKYKEFLNEMIDKKDKSFKKGIIQKCEESKNKFEYVNNTINFFYKSKNFIASKMEEMRKYIISYNDYVIKSKDENAIIENYKNLASAINEFELKEKNLEKTDNEFELKEKNLEKTDLDILNGIKLDILNGVKTDLNILNGIKNEYVRFFNEQLNDISLNLAGIDAKIYKIKNCYEKIRKFLDSFTINDDKVKYNLGETKTKKQDLVDFLTKSEYKEFEELQQFIDSVSKLEANNLEFENKIKKSVEKENKKDNGKKIEKKTKKNKEIQDFKESKEYLEFKKVLNNTVKNIFNKFYQQIEIKSKIDNLDVIKDIRKNFKNVENISNRINYELIIEIKKEFSKRYEKKLAMYNAIKEFYISYEGYINSSNEIEVINEYIKKYDDYFNNVLSCVNDVNGGHRNLKSQINLHIKKCKKWCEEYEQDVENIKASLRNKKKIFEIICKRKKGNIENIITQCANYYNDKVKKYFLGVDELKGKFDVECKTYRERFFEYYNEEIYKLKEIFLEKVNDISDINNNSGFKKLGDIKIENDDNIDYNSAENLNLVNVAFGYYKRQPKKNAEVLNVNVPIIEKADSNELPNVENNNISEIKEYSDEQNNNNNANSIQVELKNNNDANPIQVELQNNNDANPIQWGSKGKFNGYKNAVNGKKNELCAYCDGFVRQIDIYLNCIYKLKDDYERIDYLINVLSNEDKSQENDNKKGNKNNRANNIKGIKEGINNVSNFKGEITKKSAIFDGILSECNGIDEKLRKLNNYKEAVKDIGKLELYEEFSRIMGNYNDEKNLLNKDNKQSNEDNKQFIKVEKQMNKVLIDDEHGINNIQFKDIFNRLRDIYNNENNNFNDEYKIINGLDINFYCKLKNILKVIFEEEKLSIDAQEEGNKSNISDDEEGFIDIKNYYQAYIEFYNNFAKEICKIFYSKDDNLLLNNIIKDLIGKIDKYNNLKNRLATYLKGDINNKNKNKALVLSLERGQHDVHYTEGAVIFLFDEFLKLCVEINKDFKFIKYLINNFIKVFERGGDFDGLKDIIGDTDGVFERLVEINKNLSTLSQKIFEAPEDKSVINLDSLAQQKQMTKAALIKNIDFIYKYIENYINKYFTYNIVSKFKERTKGELEFVNKMFENVSRWYSYDVLETNYKNLKKINATCNLLYCGKGYVSTDIKKSKEFSDEDIDKSYIEKHIKFGEINEGNCILSLFKNIEKEITGVCEGYDNSKKDNEHIKKCKIHRLSLFIKMWMEKYMEAVKYFDDNENIGSIWKIDRGYEMDDFDYRNVVYDRFKLFNGGDLFSNNKKYGYFYGCKEIYDKLESISHTLEECLKLLYDEKGEDEINENLEENNELDNSNDKSSFGPYQLLNLINKCRSDYEEKIHSIEEISYKLVEGYTKNSFDKNKKEKVKYDKILILFIQVKFIKFLQDLYSRRISDEIGNIDVITNFYYKLFNDADEGKKSNVLYGANNKIDKIIAAVIRLNNFKNPENVGKENVVADLCTNICNVLSAETIKGLEDKRKQLKKEFAAVENIYRNGDNKDNKDNKDDKDNKNNKNGDIDEELESELKKYFVLNKINKIYNNLSEEIIGKLDDEFKLYYENCIKLEKNNDKNDLDNDLNTIIDNNKGDENIKNMDVQQNMDVQNMDVQKNANRNVLKQNVEKDLPERYNVVLENKGKNLDSFLGKIKEVFETHKKSFSKISENLEKLEDAYRKIVKINDLYKTSSGKIEEINKYLKEVVLRIDFSKKPNYKETFNQLIGMFSELVEEVTKIKEYIKEKPKDSANINGGAQENIMNANVVLGNDKGKNLKNQKNVKEESPDVKVFGYNVTECISTYARNVIDKLNKELFGEQNKEGNGLDMDLLPKGPNLMKNLPFENNNLLQEGGEDNNLPQNNNENNNLKDDNGVYFKDVMSKVNEKLKDARLRSIKDQGGYIDYLDKKQDLFNFEEEINYFKNLCGSISKILGGIFDTSSVSSTKGLFDKTINDLAGKIKLAKDEYIKDVISLKEDEIKNIAGDCIVKNKDAIKRKLAAIALICKDENIFNNEDVKGKVKEIEGFLMSGFEEKLEGNFKNIPQNDIDKFIKKKPVGQSVIWENLYFNHDAILKLEVDNCLKIFPHLSDIISLLFYLGIDKKKIYDCILNIFSGNNSTNEYQLFYIFSSLFNIGVPKKGFIDIFGVDFNELGINCAEARDKVLKISNFNKGIGHNYSEFFRYDVSYHNAEFSKRFIKNILDEKEGFSEEVVKIYKDVVESYNPFRESRFKQLKEECAEVYKKLFCVGNKVPVMSSDKFINLLKNITGIDFSSDEVKSAYEFSSSLKNIRITKNKIFSNMYPMIQELTYNISQYYIAWHKTFCGYEYE